MSEKPDPTKTIRERMRKTLPQEQENFVRRLVIAKSKTSNATWERVIRGGSKNFMLLKTLAEVLKITIEQLTDENFRIPNPQWTEKDLKREMTALKSGLTSTPEAV